MLHSGEKQLSLVKKLTTSKAVWDKLKATYQQTDLATQVTAQKKLSQLVMTEDTQIVDFIEEFQGILGELSVSGLDIPKDEQYVHLLGALLPSWRPFVSSQGANTNRTLSNLTAKSLEESAMQIYEDSKQPPTRSFTPGAFLVHY